MYFLLQRLSVKLAKLKKELDSEEMKNLEELVIPASVSSATGIIIHRATVSIYTFIYLF